MGPGRNRRTGSCHCSMIRVFRCEDTLTGILTGVYDAWDSRLGHANVRLTSSAVENLELFCEYTDVEPDAEKAGKVFRTVERRMGMEAADMIAYASACPHEKKADAIYRMIVMGLHLPDGREVCHMLTCPEVRLIFELRRKAWHIAHRYMGFVRFRELENGGLFAVIEPEADVLAMIAPHFADRLPLEHWAILDRIRDRAAVHPAGKNWFLLDEVDEKSLSMPADSCEEPYFQRLWRGFHRAVGIEERENRRLQQAFLPLKFRHIMTEFQDQESRDGCGDVSAGECFRMAKICEK